MEKDKMVFYDIDWFLVEKLPKPLLEQAKKQSIDLERKGIITVEWFLYKGDKDFTYRFTKFNVPILPNTITNFLKALAKEDGIDLETAFKVEN